MDIKIGYKEIECFVDRHYGLCVGLSMVNEKTIELTYKHNRYIPAITLHLSVAEIGDTYAVFNYSSPMLVGKVIEKVVSMLGKSTGGYSHIIPRKKRNKSIPARHRGEPDITIYDISGRFTYNGRRNRDYL